MDLLHVTCHARSNSARPYYNNGWLLIFCNTMNSEILFSYTQLMCIFKYFRVCVNRDLENNLIRNCWHEDWQSYFFS